ncbi:peptide-methionine (R)-S-oxide reductase MsrB [Chenggangzhangella methanolivorans]|uniref:peptide-methionine (R)-S-oxide reductase MsrB n=1 Tax=Chenggangzhangella methanolivorans TaxID=1437009 RepID=UPI003611094A
MVTRRGVLVVGAAAGALAFGVWGRRPAVAAEGSFEIAMSDAEWRKRLTEKQFSVLRLSGTERPYSSPLNDERRKGRFACAGCENPLFSSETKFDSGTGWPSFWAPLDKAIGTGRDTAFGMEREEVHCARCGGHLGHVFNDGPKPTGLRYCMNGVAMTFRPAAA